MDTQEGTDDNPLSHHKYLYTNVDPVDGVDPSGNDDISDTLDSMAIPQAIQYAHGGSAEPRVATVQSAEGSEFLKWHEGDNGKPDLKPYDNDGSTTGNCTIGWGHKIRDGKCTAQDFRNYASFDEGDAEDLLAQDVQLIAMPPIKTLVKVGLAQRELDALVDFTFNLRWHLKQSALLQQLNAGKYPEAGDGFMGWLTPKGIRQRRVDEKNLWDTGIYISNGHAID
jgi:GH24 family phage-related lysozyme (muramidase)